MRVRVAGLLIVKETVLLVNHVKQKRSYWLLPGGGVELGESLHKALQRELAEELNLRVRTGRLLFVVEAISGMRGHLLQPTFALGILDESEVPWVGADRRVRGYHFFAAEELTDVFIYPDIRDELVGFLEGKILQRRYIVKKWLD